MGAFCITFDLHYIKLPFVSQIFVLSIFEWLLKIGFTVGTYFATILFVGSLIIIYIDMKLVRCFCPFTELVKLVHVADDKV